MKQTLKLQVRTAERIVLETEARSVILRGPAGQFQLLPGHEPLAASLILHQALIEDAAGNTVRLAVHGGLVRVHEDTVAVLADACERADQIDVRRARAAIERAEKRLQQKDKYDTARALQALARARLRIDTADGAC